MHHEAVEIERQVAGCACPCHFLHAQEYPVLDGVPPTSEGGIFGPGLLGLDELVVKETKIGARNRRHQPTRGFCVFNTGDCTSVSDAKDDRLRLCTQKTVQPSADRCGATGVVGPTALLA